MRDERLGQQASVERESHVTLTLHIFPVVIIIILIIIKVAHNINNYINHSKILGYITKITYYY